MNTEEIRAYLFRQYQEFLEPISRLSTSTKRKILVSDHRELFNFDKISEKIYSSKKPSSADSIYISENEVILIEFKSGFKKVITKNNFDISKIACPDDSARPCYDYAKLLFQKQKCESRELLDSIRLKAIESYITLEKEILPFCSDSYGLLKKRKFIFCAVVDDYIDSMEDTLNELSGKSSDNNTITSIKNALSRLILHKNYYYTEIKVFSPYEFIQYLNEIYFDSPYHH